MVLRGAGCVDCLDGVDPSILDHSPDDVVMEMKNNAMVIEKACDDIKLSIGLKKVLKTILRVGNQMNDADKVSTFDIVTLD